MKEVSRALGYEWNQGKKEKDGRWQRTVNKNTEEYIWVCPTKERKKELELRRMRELLDKEEKEENNNKRQLFPWEV